jgi:hypothetical protein
MSKVSIANNQERPIRVSHAVDSLRVQTGNQTLLRTVGQSYFEDELMYQCLEDGRPMRPHHIELDERGRQRVSKEFK